ncbi:MAG TPA: hypothetical protein VK850_19305, partial [Candidatus Binatia bacterium]|nr:hypothetical protein [Candidatus Binatia bacterium]
MKRKLLYLFIIVHIAVFAMTARAQLIVFEDTFESGLSQWTGQFAGPHHGKLVGDPLNAANHVLTFTGVNAAGDIYSAAAIPASTVANRYVLSFDFLALSSGDVPPVEYGGFAGINTGPGSLSTHYWLGGTYAPALNVPAPVATVLATDGRWHHYEIDFTDILRSNAITAFYVMLEDWYDRGSIPGDIYFDNVRVVVEVGGSLDGLITAVENSDLPANRKRPLLASLEAAQASFARGDIGAFANQLRAFENKVQAQVESANAALANRLISLAQ